MNKTQIAALPTSKLVSLYNHLTGKSITKFADRATGIKQVEKALAASTDGNINASLKKAGIDGDAATTKALAVPVLMAPKKAEAPAKKVAAKKAAKVPADRSAAISASWKDPATAAARSTKHKVSINGTEYRSLEAAMRALKMDVSKLIKLRLELKDAGKITIGEYKVKLIAHE